MNSRAHIALGALLLLVPEFFGVLLFRYVVKTSVIVHDPAAVTAERVLVPFSFGVLAPFPAVTPAEADAVLLVQVYADRDRLVFHHEGQKFSLLHHLDFGIAEFQFLCQYLKVAGGDLCGNGHDLVGLGVDLHEYLGLAAVRRHGVREDGPAGLEMPFLLFAVFLQRRFLQYREEYHVGFSVFLAHESETASFRNGVPVLVAYLDGQDGRVSAVTDFLQGSHRQVFNHFLGESEPRQGVVGQFLELKSYLFHILI